MAISVVAASIHEKDVEFCKAIAARCKFDFKHITTNTDLTSYLVEYPTSLVFIDIDSGEAISQSSALSIFEAVPIIKRYTKSRQVFGLANHPIFDLPYVNRFGAIGHYCVRNFDDFGIDWISKICSPLFSNEPFGADFYRDPGADVHKIELKNSKDRATAIAEVARRLQTKNIHDRALQMILRGLDELLMNSIFDAPVDADGRRYRKETPRDSRFDLKGRETVTLQVVLNEKNAIIGVMDQFGSFDAEEATQAASQNYSQTEYVPDQKTASAGMGLQGIAASGASILISCKSGKGTEAILAFPYFRSYKEMKNVFHSFSFNNRSSIGT